MHVRRAPLALFSAALAVSLVGTSARAETGSTFDNFAPGVSLNNDASFSLTGMSGTGQVTVDPSNPDLLIAINRVTTATGGMYAFNFSTQQRVTNANGPVFIGNAAPMTWSSTSNDPYSAVVGTDGSVYIGMYTSAGIYKIVNPLSETPTITRIMSSYVNGGGDDDIVNLARVPAGFDATGYTTNDLVIFDDGNNADGINTVSVLHSDGSDGNAPHIVWQRTGAAGGTIHGATSAKDGYAYWFNTVPEHNVIDGTDYVSVYRVKGDGVLQTIGVQLPAGVALAGSDDPIAINPVDGSIWFADVPAGSTGDVRTMLRLDTAHLTPSTSDPNMLIGTATSQFTAALFNIGVNGLTFSNDGTRLYAGTPNGTDKLWAFNVTPDVGPTHITGDTNGDGTVDLSDLNNVLNNFGSTAAGNPGDDNHDNVVDLQDLNNVLNNFGAHAAASALAVPEPATLSLAAIAAVATLGSRRRRAI